MHRKPFDQVTISTPVTFPLSKITPSGTMSSDTAFMTYQLGSDPTENLPFTTSATTWTLTLTNIITTTGTYSLAVSGYDISGGDTNSTSLIITADSLGGGLVEQQVSPVKETLQ